jgi:hypothetical protein
MVLCPRCGVENYEDAVYCANCGAQLNSRGSKAYREESDYLGAASSGVILIILAITYFRYPFDFTLISDYIQRMATLQRYIKPPTAFFVPAIFFFNAVGVWSLVLGGLRVVFQRSLRRAIGDFAGGLFIFFFAFLLSSYADNVIRGWTVLAYLIVGIGLLVILQGLMHWIMSDSRRTQKR